MRKGEYALSDILPNIKFIQINFPQIGRAGMLFRRKAPVQQLSYFSGGTFYGIFQQAE